MRARLHDAVRQPAQIGAGLGVHQPRLAQGRTSNADHTRHGKRSGRDQGAKMGDILGVDSSDRRFKCGRKQRMDA